MDFLRALSAAQELTSSTASPELAGPVTEAIAAALRELPNKTLLLEQLLEDVQIETNPLGFRTTCMRALHVLVRDIEDVRSTAVLARFWVGPCTKLFACGQDTDRRPIRRLAGQLLADAIARLGPDADEALASVTDTCVRAIRDVDAGGSIRGGFAWDAEAPPAERVSCWGACELAADLLECLPAGRGELVVRAFGPLLDLLVTCESPPLLLHAANTALTAAVAASTADAARSPPAAAAHLDRMRALFETCLTMLERGRAESQTDALGVLCRFYEELEASACVLDDPRFWDALSSGLVASDPLARKRALYLSKRAVEALGAPRPGRPWPLFVPWPSRALWDSFFLVFDTLDTHALHLIEPVWPQIDSLAGWEAPPSAAPHAARHFAWLAALLRKVLEHGNFTVAKLALDWLVARGPGPGGLLPPPSFLVGHVMRALGSQSFYRDGDGCRREADFAARFRAYFGACAAAYPPADLADLQRTLLAVACDACAIRPALMLQLGCLEAAAGRAAGGMGPEALDAVRRLASDRIPGYQPACCRARMHAAALRAALLLADPTRVPLPAAARLAAAFPPAVLAAEAAAVERWLAGMGPAFSAGLPDTVDTYVRAPGDTLPPDAQLLRRSPEPPAAAAVTAGDVRRWREAAQQIACLARFVPSREAFSSLLAPLFGKLGGIFRQTYMPRRAPERLLVLLDTLLAHYGWYSPAQRKVLAEGTAMVAEEVVAYCSDRVGAEVSASGAEEEGAEGTRVCLLALHALAQPWIAAPSIRPALARLMLSARRLLASPAVAAAARPDASSPALELGKLNAARSVWVAAACALSSGEEFDAAVRAEQGAGERPWLEATLEALVAAPPVQRPAGARGHPSGGLGKLAHLEGSSGLNWLGLSAEHLVCKADAALSLLRLAARRRLQLPAGVREAAWEALSADVGHATHEHAVALFEALSHLVPHVLEADGGTAARIEPTLSCAWSLVCELTNRLPISALSFMRLLLPPPVASRPDLLPLLFPAVRLYAGKLIAMGEKERPRLTNAVPVHVCGAVLAPRPSAAPVFAPLIVDLCISGAPKTEHDDARFATEGGGASLGGALGGLLAPHDDEAGLAAALLGSELPVSGLFARRLTNVWLARTLAEAEAPEAAGAAGARRADCRAAVRAVLEALLERNEARDMTRDYKVDSIEHRRKIRLWQSICLLSPAIAFDRGLALDVERRVWRVLLDQFNLASVRQYMELVLVRLMCIYPDRVEAALASRLDDMNHRPQKAQSLLLIATRLLASMVGRPADLRRQSFVLVPRLAPYLASQSHTVRALAVICLRRILDELLVDFAPDPRATASAATSDGHGPDQWWGALGCQLAQWQARYLRENADLVKVWSRQTKYFLDSLPPEKACALDVLINTAEGTAVGAEREPSLPAAVGGPGGVALAPVELLASFLKHGLSFDYSDPASAAATAAAAGEEEEAAAVDAGNFQRKMVPWSEMDVGIAAAAASKAELVDRRRQQIVLVASLIDRVPNLAGLARTCEVFLASRLVVPSRAVLDDVLFKQISVSADKWVPIDECPPEELVAYLRNKRAEGYALLGLEQTANSACLSRFEFPPRVVLVLGREKEGIPTELIQMLDACIEIPQLGVIRSLNVHVSGAITLWEYTRQQRVRAAAASESSAARPASSAAE